MIAWSNTAAKDDEGAVEYVIRTGVNVTEREKAQTQARDSDAEVRTLHEQGEARLLHYHGKLQALTARLLALQEFGNKELARELHDGLSQDLAALGMEVSMLLKPTSGPAAKLSERVRALSTRIKGLAKDVHAMSRRLHPAILDELGLEFALKEECVRFSAQAGIPVQFESEGVALLPQEVSLCLYRVTQESLRNIAKHAHATTVKVVLSGKKDGIRLRIKDAGDGFDLNDIKGKGGGLGLISIEERVRLVNGKFTINSQPGNGTIVQVHVPLKTK